MALNQMYATTGRRVNPNYVAMINAQTPYLPALKRQAEEDKLAKKGLALQEQNLALDKEQMLTGNALEQEALEQQKKQTKRANLMAFANLGLKGGLGAYQYSEPFRTSVDRLVSGAKDYLFGGAEETAMESGLPAAVSFGDGGGGWENYADWSDFGDWSSGAGDVFSGATDILEEPIKALGETAVETGGDVFSDAISGLWNDLDFGDWDLL